MRFYKPIRALIFWWEHADAGWCSCPTVHSTWINLVPGGPIRQDAYPSDWYDMMEIHRCMLKLDRHTQEVIVSYFEEVFSVKDKEQRQAAWERWLYRDKFRHACNKFWALVPADLKLKRRQKRRGRPTMETTPGLREVLLGQGGGEHPGPERGDGTETTSRKGDPLHPVEEGVVDTGSCPQGLDQN